MSEPSAAIRAELEQIELRENVRILYAVESGSRAWGFASPDSDYDVRFVFVRPVTDYVRLRPLRDVIELPIDNSLANPLDINGWDILKAFNLFRSSNPPLMEWLHSPLVYQEHGALAFETTLEGITFAYEIRSKLSDLLQRKRLGGEIGAEAKDVVLTEFIEAEMERISALVRDLPDPEMPEEPLNSLLWKELGLHETATGKDGLEHGK